MGKTLRLLMLVVFLGLIQLMGSPQAAFSQTDTEFWFVAPNVSKSHGWAGRKFYMRFASLNIPAEVTISMPANPAFTPITFDLPANSAHTEELTAIIEDIWNFPPAQVNNRGIHITATSLITAYFEVGTHFNPDIYSLKGRNGLGKEFYVPFQNFFRNGDYSPDQPYSKIDIVATQDNTTVTIIPSKAAHLNEPPGVPIVVVLNRGETYSVAPNHIQTGDYPRQGQLPGNRLTGSRIIADKPIAVTTSDDSVDAIGLGGCRDLIGDQLIPTNIIGTEYIAMRSRLAQGSGAVVNMPEFFFVVGTQDDTDVFVDGVWVDNITAGETLRYQFSTDADKKTYHIRTSKPSYVFHVGGFGCEMGGAILPPVNVCTGSTQVSFTRSKGGSFMGVKERFFLNIMVRAGAQDGFILNGDGPNTIINEAHFSPVEGTTKWLAAEFEFDEDIIPVAEAGLIQNTKDVFHLGIINGGPTSGTMYGYFSDFHELKATSLIVGVGTDFEAFCYGQPAQLIATGGINYSWSPPDFLDDPFIQTPTALPDQSMQYVVTVSGACDMVDSASVTIQVADPLHAVFTVDNTVGCSPFELTVFNQSIGVENYSWKFGDGQNSNINIDSFNHVYVNDSDSIQTFELSLVGRNNLFCVDTMTTMITVYPEVRSKAEADVLSGCAPFTVNFFNQSHGGSEYLWKFGDGGSSAQFQTSHTFQNYSDKDTTYAVVLKVRNQFGCEDFDTLHVHVKPYVKSGFEFDAPQHCNPFDLEITNTSFGATHYTWNFDDGTPEQHHGDSTFTYFYENLGTEPDTFHISLVTYNNYGCADTLVRPFTLFPLVRSEFVPSALSGCQPLSVSFENSSVGAASYNWIFGQGQGTSSDAEPEFEFVNPDPNNAVTHQVMLLVESEFGCQDTSWVDITVYPRVDAEFAFDYAEGCAPQEIVFSNLSVGATTNVWSFGDGTQPEWTNDSVVSHVFDTPSGEPVVYPVSLWVQNDFGCAKEKIREVTIYPEVVAGFSTITSGCHPLDVEFQNQSLGATKFFWDFGDGGSSTAANPTRTFVNNSPTETVVYNVRLVAESPSRCRDTLEIPITVYPKPKALLSLSDNAGCAPFTINMIDQSIGHIQSLWNFGDGNGYESQPGDTLHTFNNQTDAPLVYQPILEVVNEHGCVDTVSKLVTVYPLVNAQVSFSELSGCHPFEVQITNNTTGANAAMPYYWSYGDGQSSTTQQTTHTHVFNNPSHSETALYSTKLLAMSTWGCKDSLYVDVEVFPRPKALFASPDEPSCSPFEVHFTDLSEGASNGNYFWNFGDGAQSEDHGSTSHIFNQPPDAGLGWFSTTLTVVNEFECDNTHTRNVGVYPLVIADFTTQEDGCHPLDVQFNNTSQGANAFQWDFDDGSHSNQSGPEHVFFNTSNTDVKTYQVQLQATSQFDCQAQTTRTITVFPLPGADFAMSDYQGCSPLEVTLNNNTVGGISYDWTMGNAHTQNDQEQFQHTFQNLTDSVKNIPVILDAYNQWGCTKAFSKNVTVYPEVVAAFTTQSGEFEGCTPLGLPFVNLSERADQFTWTFGDGTQSTGMNPEHWFFAPGTGSEEYPVTLRAQSAYGCKDTLVIPVRVHPKPVADFSASPNHQTYPSTTIELVNLSLPGTWQYSWDMGDENTLVHHDDPGTFSHTYIWQGTDYSTRYYTIRLKVSNDWCEDEIARQVVIHAPDPVVAFGPQDKGCPPFDVQFENYSQYGTAYFWDFDDGNFSTEEHPHHTFWEPGLYNVKLVVSGEGGIDSTYRTITVHQPPIANFKVVPPVVTIPDATIQIVNLSTMGHSWHWDFGDGHESFDFSPSHTYAGVGSYDISLLVGSNTDPVCYDTMVQQGAAVAEESCVIYFPNAFAPSTTGPSGGHYISGDPLNQVFYPVYDGIEEYKLEIYNRWGELIFRSEDLEIGWDGYYRGELSKMDVYVWKVWARCYSGKKIIQAGDVTLYR
jgi:PKD repeat protein